MVLNLKKFVFLFLSIALFSPLALLAQEENHAGLNHTFHRAHVSRASTHTKTKVIYKRPSKNRMYSNECVHDYTVSKMGFEYVILTGDCEAALGHRSGFEMELANFITEVGIFFRRGPFWKYKIKKRFKFCKERMGDYVE
jgi:hypothetical protein